MLGHNYGTGHEDDAKRGQRRGNAEASSNVINFVASSMREHRGVNWCAL
jgi:hypothetical protein